MGVSAMDTFSTSLSASGTGSKVRYNCQSVAVGNARVGNPLLDTVADRLLQVIFYYRTQPLRLYDRDWLVSHSR